MQQYVMVEWPAKPFSPLLLRLFLSLSLAFRVERRPRLHPGLCKCCVKQEVEGGMSGQMRGQT